jgi:hypothetical protein
LFFTADDCEGFVGWFNDDKLGGGGTMVCDGQGLGFGETGFVGCECEFEVFG